MSIVPLASRSARAVDMQLVGDNTDPRTLDAPARSEIERLFDLARRGEIPRYRELKSWEPATLNERHLLMIAARAGGTYQTDIASAFGVTDSHVSIVLNHPDSEYILTRLQAMKASAPSNIEQRLEALNDDAVGALEDLFSDVEISPVKKAPAAFKLLEMNGVSKKKPDEVVHTLRADPKQLSAIQRALHERQLIQTPVYVEVGPGKPLTAGTPQGGTGESLSNGSLLPGGAGFAGSSDAGAPSTSDSQADGAIE